MASNNDLKEKAALKQQLLGLDKQSLTYEKDKLELAKKLRDLNLKIQKENREYYKDAENSLSSYSSIQTGLKNLERERISLQMQSSSISTKLIEKTNNITELNRQLANLSSEQNIERQLMVETIEAELDSLKSQKGISDNILSNLREQKRIAEGLSMQTEEQRSDAEKHMQAIDNIRATFGGILSTLSTLTSGPMGMLGSGLIAAGFAVDKMSESMHDFGMGVNETTATAAGMGMVFKDANGTIRGISNEMGGLEAASFGTQLNANLLAQNLNLSGDEVGSLYGNFSRLNGGSKEMAENMISTTKEFAKQQGVIPSDVMKDVAQSSKAFAEYGREGGKNIAQAAVMASKLGVNMATVTGVTDTLLDFESSITTELELGAMLGRNINFNKARQLAYDGKIGASVKEAIKQMGGINEFNKMDVFQKRQAAAALGVSVEELNKMASNMDKLNDDGSMQLSTFDRTKEVLKGIVAGPLGGMLKGLGSGVIAVGQMGQGFKSMGIDLGGIARKMGGMFGGIGKKMGGMFAGGGGAKTPEVPKGTGKGMSSVTSSISKINPAKLLAGAAALVLVSAAVFVFAKAVQEFMQVSWGAVGMAVVSMLALVAAVALLGAIMMSGVGAVAILAGAAAMLVVATSVLILGMALQEMAKGFEMLGMVSHLILGVVAQVPAIMVLTMSLFALAGALTAVGTAGLVSLPGLIALGAIGAAVTGINSLLGIEPTAGGERVSDYQNQMLTKMDTLITEVKANRDIYLDKEKVTNVVKRQSERTPGNTFGLDVA